MSALSGPTRVSRIFRRILPGSVGAAACSEFDSEYAERRVRSGRNASAGSSGVGISMLDFKLGVRMLFKHPGLTAVSAFAVAVSVAVGVGCFSFINDYIARPTVPLEEGERIVALGLRNDATNRMERRLLHDFAVWREELRSVDEVSAFQHATRNIIRSDGTAEPVRLTRMSASGFRVARVPPLLGRPLLDADEAEGAPPVLVIGYNVWQNRFEADPGIVGRTVQVDRERYTIVGVMPEDYAFPLADDLWIPLQWNPSDHEPLAGSGEAYAFGRLAPGGTRAQAEAEMAVLSQRRAAELPETHEHLRGQVLHYTDPHTGMDDVGGPLGLQVFLAVTMLTLVLAVPFVNVAILVYARTARRAGEIALRNALGASRLRVVTQLFIESFVLASVAAVIGVALALFGLEKAQDVIAADYGGAPFWARQGRDPTTIAYGLGLTVAAAVIAGVIPGLKATGKGVQASLARLASGNGMRMGGMWTVLIVAQVATTVAVVPPAITLAWQGVGQGIVEPTFPTEQLLAAGIAEAPGPGSTNAEARGADVGAVASVARRLEEEREVTAITWASAIPGEAFEEVLPIEVENASSSPDGQVPWVGSLGVAVEFFETLDVAVLQGRTFHSGDLEADIRPVMVNRTFVRQILGDANPVGRRLRTVDRDDPDGAVWQEIVGVVDDLVTYPVDPAHAKSRIFSPLPPLERLSSATLVLRVPSSPEGYAPRLRQLTATVDPTLQLRFVTPLSDLDDPLRSAMRMLGLAIGVAVLSVLLLATAGVYALMSFNVTHRRREIGIRSALGAQPGRVLANVFSRAAMQLGIGAFIGVAGALLLDLTLVRELDMGPPPGPGLLLVVVALVVGAGLLAIVGPVRRGLRIEPSEALRGV